MDELVCEDSMESCRLFFFFFCLFFTGYSGVKAVFTLKTVDGILCETTVNFQRCKPLKTLSTNTKVFLCALWLRQRVDICKG